jgi:hypothetical protein
VAGSELTRMGARTGAVLALAALAACSRGEAAAAAAVAEPRLSVPGWSLEPAGQVGGADAREQEQLFMVSSVAEDADGRFYVANFGDKRVLVFDSAGTFVRAIGRGGRGPGEFTAPRSVAALGDELLVLDMVLGRISRFGRADGAFRGDVAFPQDAGMPAEMRTAANGSVMVEFRPRTSSGVQSPAYIAPVNATTGAVDRTVAVQLDTVPRVQLRTEKKGSKTVVTIDLPFAPRPVWDVDAGGALLYGTGARYVVNRARAAQRTPVFSGTGDPRPVSRDDREGFFAGSEQMEQFRGKVQFPERHPYYTGLRAGPDGSLWVRVPGGPGERWDVRDASGQVRGTLDLPRGSRLMSVSPGAVYVLGKDEQDVETVHRLRIRR